MSEWPCQEHDHDPTSFERLGLYSCFMPLSRRSFVAGLLASPAAAAYLEAAQSAPPMRIRRIETVYWKAREDAPFWPHWTWVKIDADPGVSGIGETYPRNSNEAAAIHGAASQLIGRDPP